ncbi:type II toxin-antitoxin system PrlF family antitoxin [Pseudomonas japonica]|uniref:type II toxin-antitoxin system PrlF family antitoxin n=1 Tax=Pseudomonas japonica TaxID=256466 RepID=UPI0035C16791
MSGSDVSWMLDMLERDIIENPGRLEPIDPSLVSRLAELCEGVEVDLDAALSPDDE